MADYQNDLKHIRDIMERSGTFLSLSGLSGVAAGVIALCGFTATMYVLESHQIHYVDGSTSVIDQSLIIQIGLIAVGTLLLGLISAIWFSLQKSKKQYLPFWTEITRQLLVAGSIPLLTGGVFSMILLSHKLFIFIAPVMLIFYGLALISASRFTQKEIFWLGLSEITLGLISASIPGNGLLFWGIGFGILHIIYGTLMYYKYK